MLRLGHIHYANCFPVHALLLDRAPPAGVRVVSGVPTELNAELAGGTVDIAPASSVEYARNADRYRLLPGIAIASAGPVRSILVESTAPLPELDGRKIALPTASATSVVLLRILLEKRHGIQPIYEWFDQASGRSPVDGDAAAALWIGDDALRRAAMSPHDLVDLGREWVEWTGLPFVFALWQTSLGAEHDDELGSLHTFLLQSLAYFEANAPELARRHAARFELRPRSLLEYWRSITYRLDARAREGLMHFYRCAADIGAVERPPALHWIEPAPAV